MVKTYKKGVAVKLSDNFKSTEFDCHGSGCCTNTLIDDKLVEYVQKIRNHFGKPITVTSGYRCPTHNKRIGGATGSRHSKGQAADIVVKDIAPREVAKYAESIGILGIGLYETSSDGHFVHVDTRDYKSFWYGQNEAKRTTFGGTPIQEEKEEVVKPDTSKIDTSAADPEVIWNFLKAKGLNDYGIAGLMGNLNAESALKPTNLQNSYENKLNMNDAEYTAAVDAGTYTNFAKDAAGYGLAQWTYHTRKQAMLDFHKKAGKSIGDLNTQLEFLVYELTTSYATSVWAVLKNATSILEASNAVLMKFERPANMGENVQAQRAKFGQVYYDKYAKSSSSPVQPEVEKPVEPFKVGDTVKLIPGATYVGGGSIANWVFNKKLYIRSIRKNGDYVISTLKTGAITGVVPSDVVIAYDATVAVQPGFDPYLVKVTASALNVRAGAGTQYKIITQLPKNGVYTIVGENNGWGKLKNGSGWISLEYVKKLNLNG